MAPEVQLDESASGRDVHLHLGQRLAVALPAATGLGTQCWIQSPADAILEVEQEPARPVRRTQWVLRAMRNGQGHLRFECQQDVSGERPRLVEFRVRVD